jgi:CDP-4-dehydro-6-deoxyglucose reductase/3-phenylpropionate/trans-cinnamate dioxygenase ferredoxin reductase subunit
MRQLPVKWAGRHQWFSFEPVLSAAGPLWRGRRGLVHEAVSQDFPDLSQHQVYACGNPLMVRRAKSDFSARRMLDPDDFFSDAFVPTGAVDAFDEAQTQDR